VSIYCGEKSRMNRENGLEEEEEERREEMLQSRRGKGHI
jgi:hypothetical protein